MASDIIQPTADQKTIPRCAESWPARVWRASRRIVAATLLWAITTIVLLSSETPARAGDVTVVGSARPYPLVPSNGDNVLQEPGTSSDDASNEDLSGSPVTVIGHPYRSADHPLGYQAPALPFLAPVVVAEPCVESMWYGKIEYYQWDTEEKDIFLKNREFGAMSTLGYRARMGSQRGRIEFFGGDVRYQEDLGNDEWGNSHSGYFGARLEYEYLWDIDLDGFPVTFFAGLGTRAWGRRVSDYAIAFVGERPAYSQSWWTIYPYVGLERNWRCVNGDEFFAMGRVGATVITYLCMPSYGDVSDLPVFNPRTELTGQVELGWRRDHFSLAGFFEVMSWACTDEVHRDNSSGQEWWVFPGAHMLTTGLKLSLIY